MSSALDIISYFKSVEKLINVNFYLSDSKQINNLYEQKNLLLIKKNNFKIENLNILKENFLALTNKSRVELRHKNKKLANIENFFLADNLNVLKCDSNTLYQILKDYDSLQALYSKGKKTFKRNLIWIPERSLLSDDNLTIKFNRLCSSFQIYILNLKIDLDHIIKNIQHKMSIRDLTETGTLSLKVYQPSVICPVRPYIKPLESELNFKVKHGRIYLTNSQLVAAEHESNKYEKKPKRSYRIVSNHVEPFVIISNLDEHLSSKDECKDGMPCLDINLNSNFYQSEKNNSNEKLIKLIEKENIIELIKNFKYLPDEDINLNLVKTMCCTGYMINLLQKLSNDLDFEFELYFVNYKDDEKKTVKWSEAIDHVINQVAHIIAGPFSITQERSDKIDFSVPFLYTGYSILMKQEKKGVDDLWMFMRPFTNLHWVCIGLFGLLTAISLALLEFNSPFGLNPNGRQRARNYTLGSAVSVFISLSNLINYKLFFIN